MTRPDIELRAEIAQWKQRQRECRAVSGRDVAVRLRRACSAGALVDGSLTMKTDKWIHAEIRRVIEMRRSCTDQPASSTKTATLIAISERLNTLEDVLDEPKPKPKESSK